MRNYVRHPSTIPIELIVDCAACSGRPRLANIATGGFACTVDEPLEVGASVQLRVPMIWPEYRVCGTVKWCRAVDTAFEVGIEFGAQDLFKARMVEQLSQIEHYRNQLWIEEGRIVDGEQAAAEWIARYAQEFSDAFQGRL